MTKPGGDETGRRRRRRYVAPPQRLGPGADAVFATPRTQRVASSPQDAGDEPPGEEPSTGATSGDAVLPNRAAEDEPTVWGEPGEDENDERLRRDRPPHWG